MDDKDFLEHYGKIGMHWGKRSAKSTTSSPAAKLNNSDDHNKKMALKGKKIHEMSNDELRLYTQRAALERQYKEQTKKEISLGRKVANNVISSATKGATDMALSYVNKRAAKMVEDLIKKSTKAVT